MNWGRFTQRCERLQACALWPARYRGGQENKMRKLIVGNWKMNGSLAMLGEVDI